MPSNLLCAVKHLAYTNVGKLLYCDTSIKLLSKIADKYCTAGWPYFSKLYHFTYLAQYLYAIHNFPIWHEIEMFSVHESSKCLILFESYEKARQEVCKQRRRGDKIYLERGVGVVNTGHFTRTELSKGEICKHLSLR